MISLMEWNEIIKDEKEKRLCENRVNEPTHGKIRYFMIVLSTL